MRNPKNRSRFLKHYLQVLGNSPAILRFFAVAPSGTQWHPVAPRGLTVPQAGPRCTTAPSTATLGPSAPLWTSRTSAARSCAVDTVVSEGPTRENCGFFMGKLWIFYGKIWIFYGKNGIFNGKKLIFYGKMGYYIGKVVPQFVVPRSVGACK